ncbi:hypothetical protein [Kitasatospora purpeofusca]
MDEVEPEWVDPRYADIVAEYKRAQAAGSTTVRLFIVDRDE